MFRFHLWMVAVDIGSITLRGVGEPFCKISDGIAPAGEAMFDTGVGGLDTFLGSGLGDWDRWEVIEPGRSILGRCELREWGRVCCRRPWHDKGSDASEDDGNIAERWLKMLAASGLCSLVDVPMSWEDRDPCGLPFAYGRRYPFRGVGECTGCWMWCL